MIRDNLLQKVAVSRDPVSTAALAASTGLDFSSETLAAVDVLLALSLEVNQYLDGWVMSVDTRDRRILNALHDHVTSYPEKKIFRVVAALGNLSAEDQMTEQQLQALLSRTGEFELLPNAMIKRGS